MNHLCKTLLGGALFLGGLAANAQGLEGIIVEDYYTITANDADYLNNTVGVTYPITAGTKVYRIYVDMAPNYKLNTVNGSPLPQGGGVSPNPLDFTTTTTFWNEDGFGTEVPPQTSRFDDGAAFDSYITIGLSGRSGGAVGCGANTQQAGTLKTADTNGNLTLCAVYEGFPNAGTADGNVPPGSTIPALTYNLGGLIDFTALQADGSVFEVVGDAWATLPNGPGVDPSGTNRVLIAQLTTDGDLSFHINVQLQTPDNSALETYVWQSAGPGEVVSPFLTYPQAGIPDCLGVIGGTALPGTACDDNNACTTNDLWSAQCVCAGTVQDTDGDGICNANDNCPNVAGQQGSSCNDGDACTINDVLNASCVCAGTVQDTDGDGICNANDNCPNVTGQQGSACDDGNALTINDVLNANCVCAGTPVGCIANGDCNDNDACTTDACVNNACVFTPITTDTDGDGTPDCADNCPNVAGTQGSSCDDGDACTTGDVLNASCVCAGTPDNTDSDGDGTPNCSDNCPNVAGQIGSACDDGNALTINDVLNANCACVGTSVGCVVNGDCNDQDDCTTDACVSNACVFTPVADTDGDGTCDTVDGCPSDPNKVAAGQCGCGNPEPGTACDDNNANTINDQINASCVCAGTVQGTDCLGVPGGTALPGTACDDNNAATGNDTWSANCVCEGLLIDCLGVPGGTATVGSTCNDGDACTTNDAYNANCVCAGTSVDTDGDGVCDANDNCPNVAGQVGSVCDDGNANTTNDVLNANCQCAGQPVGGCTENLTLSITLDGNPGQTSWILYDATEGITLDAGGPYSAGQANTTVTENICVPAGCYHLEVSDSGNDGISNGGYVLRDANTKRIIDASLGSFTTVSELGGVGARNFCVPLGALNILNNWCDRSNLLITSPVYCNAQPGATGYQFWIYDPHGSYNRRVVRSVNNLAPVNLNTNPIPTNTWLNIRVRPVFNGQPSEFGPACRVRFLPNSAGREMLHDDMNVVTLNLFPNPNRDGLVTITLEGIPVVDETIADIDVYDMTGKRVFQERGLAAEGAFNHRMDLAPVAEPGLYVVNVTIDGHRYNQRLVIQ